MKDYCGSSISANYFKGFEAVGGKLHFDKQGFTFKPHRVNIQKNEARIEYTNIRSVSKRNTLGIVPNGISVLTKDDLEHKFVIGHRNDVICFLENQRI